VNTNILENKDKSNNKNNITKKPLTEKLPAI